MAIGYAPVENATVLSVYRHVTDVAMLALVAVRAAVDVATVWSKCVHTPTNRSAPSFIIYSIEQVCAHSYQSEF